jgi:transcriptional regulator with XRE-family HTH domain
MPIDPNQHKNELIRYRRRWGFSRKQVARILGHRTASMLSRYERGVSFPPLLTALKLAILYRTPVAFLYLELYRQLKVDIRSAESQASSGTQQVLF